MSDKTNEKIGDYLLGLQLYNPKLEYNMFSQTWSLTLYNFAYVKTDSFNHKTLHILLREAYRKVTGI